MRLYDLTPPLSPATAVWPGDTPLSREVLLDQRRGDSVTLSTLRATVHLGAHADGPVHYGVGQPGVGELDLTHFLGPCTLLEAPARRGGRVAVSDVPGLAGGAVLHPRVLLRTGTFDGFGAWNDDFAGLEPALVDLLVSRGVITLGVDTPSIDTQTSRDLPAHAACLRGGVAILEGLDLRGVPVGDYELIALPLPLIGFDASPVRAVLRTVPG